MAAACLLDDLETYAGRYSTHGAVQRLLFIASKTEQKSLKIDANRLCLDLLKRTTNTKAYAEVHSTLKELMEGGEVAPPSYDAVWVEATQKQVLILRDVYEQDLHAAKGTQSKDQVRTCLTQLALFHSEQGDFGNAVKHTSKSREYCTKPSAVFSTCVSLIRLTALTRQYVEIQSYASKAQHATLKDEADNSKIFAAYGLYYMTQGKYKDAVVNFAQVKQQDLGSAFSDVLCAQDVALYGVLCALASLDRGEVQARLLDAPGFRECLDLVPQIRDVALDFCNCRYAACLAALGRLRESLSLDVHLHERVDDLCGHVRNRAIVQYFVPFLSVSLHDMAAAFSTNVDGIQSEVAQLIIKRQLNAKIDSHRKVLHVKHANERMATYKDAMRVSQDFLDSTQALILRMNLLKYDFGVAQPARRQKK
eukprot:NODE_9060_length_1449_cov_9.394856.p1 GENE.NODE_9060_length_1449_cov_9.394856~~NODE_9060_length_1449_cov_9.394856.p1  ORF type:complete len:450 (+),score=143.03 NODE_9060_length_1449_cov_9.394856:86-1351(+)